MSQALHLTDENFDEATSRGIALIDFWADWCGPCRMLGPVMDELAGELEGRAVVAKVKVDDAQVSSSRFAVRSLPAIFILKDGEIMRQFTGIQDKGSLLAAISEVEAE